MDHDQQFLSFIHKNAAMGVSAIPRCCPCPQSRAMGQALNSQLQEYRTIAAQSQAYARKHGARLHTQVWLSGPCPVPCSRPALPPTTPPPSWLS